LFFQFPAVHDVARRIFSFSENSKGDAMADAIKSVLRKPAPGTCPVPLMFTTQGYCGRKPLEGHELCYWHVESTDKYRPELLIGYFGDGITLKTAISNEVAAGNSMEGAYLVGAPLGGSFLEPGSNLRGGTFVRANLQSAKLSESNLEEAVFGFANLKDAYLSSCNLTKTNFIGANLHNTKFRSNALEGVIGITKSSFRGLRWDWCPTYHMLEEYPEQCEQMYRRLASYFSSENLFDDASWAAYRASLMRHKLLAKALRADAADPNDLYAWMVPGAPELDIPGFPGIYRAMGKTMPFRYRVTRFFNLLRWLRSWVERVVIGYGEKPQRVLLVSACVICLYAASYKLLGAISDPRLPTALYFSMVTFSTLGYGDVIPLSAFRLLAASEALVGVVLCGLFLFCVGRRSVGRQ
jgi:hypothetical protein